MKYTTLAICALLGLTLESNAITVYTRQGTVAYVENESSDSPSDEEHVQLSAQGWYDEEEVDHSNEYFLPNQHEMLGGGGYERVIPARYQEDTDDIFMRSMYENYALEQKTKEGNPSGKFWMDEAAARSASSEVLESHKGLKGGAKQTYLDTYFAKTWAHFDVNQVGKIEVDKMP